MTSVNKTLTKLIMLRFTIEKHRLIRFDVETSMVIQKNDTIKKLKSNIEEETARLGIQKVGSTRIQCRKGLWGVASGIGQKTKGSI